jgi:hypothetical protein
MMDVTRSIGNFCALGTTLAIDHDGGGDSKDSQNHGWVSTDDVAEIEDRRAHGVTVASGQIEVLGDAKKGLLHVSKVHV